MYYREHAPPHFHAAYGDFEVLVQIESGVVEGRFPKRALRHVRRPLRPIAPLE